MRRRPLLSLCGTVALGGCLGLDRPPAPRLAWIWLTNDREEAHEVDVTVEDGGETVLEETYWVGAGPDTANVNVENPVEGPGEYVVRARMDGETREVEAADYVDGEERCVGVRFLLLNTGGVDYDTKSMREC